MSSFIFLMSARLSKHSAHTGRRIRGRVSKRKNSQDRRDFLFVLNCFVCFLNFIFGFCFFLLFVKSLNSVIGFHPSSLRVNKNSHLYPQQSGCLCGGVSVVSEVSGVSFYEAASQLPLLPLAPFSLSLSLCVHRARTTLNIRSPDLPPSSSISSHSRRKYAAGCFFFFLLFFSPAKHAKTSGRDWGIWPGAE